MAPIRLLTLTTCHPLYHGHFNASYVQALCEHLVGLGVDVTVLAPHAPGAPREETMGGVRVIRFRYLPERWETFCYGGAAIPERLKRSWRYRLMIIPFLVAYAVSAWRVARRTRCQVIQAHWIISVAIGWLLKLTGRVPLVAVSYGVESFMARTHPWVRRITHWAFMRADCVYTISQASRDGLVDLGIPEGRIRVYAIGPDPAVAAIVNGHHPAEETGDKTVLFVGRLVRRKGVTHLMDAFAQVRRDCPDASLVIVGEGPERERLQAQAQRLGFNGQVRFVEAPTAQELAPWYRRCSVFVLPSIVDQTGDTEGLGLVLLEALTFGKPIIGTRVGGIPEIIEDGKTGLLVPAGDADALAQAITSVLTDPGLAARLAEQGGQLLATRYNWSVGAKQIYNDMATEWTRR